MRLPRAYIVGEHDVVHLFWRCHNRSHLLASQATKWKILDLYFGNKDKYQIKILDFQILDNHAHWIVQAPNAQKLGEFARTVHSQIARFINEKLKRESQAISSRYKSPPVREKSYFQTLISYVLMNRYKVTRRNPIDDPFSSAYHRIRKTEYGNQLESYSKYNLTQSRAQDVDFLKKAVKFAINRRESGADLEAVSFVNSIAVASKTRILELRREIRKRLHKQLDPT